MTRLASSFGRVNSVRRDRPLSKGDIVRARQAAGLWWAHFPPTLLYPTDPLNPIPQRELT
ncbi:hypothetical protein EGX47_04315 [Yersinia pseudotuberculosis]|uniref:Uncharacterized protein n=1 Tax=Yersinia pseudotuberculosis TaxID=633 RepID=A0ABM7ADX8_YERPU|nr:hypothetical protein [Yersinia pseudotuberculosis]AYW90625.1 hypothetical protein EGX47_04315 [Yersinia pseudotuberculosis]